jgi:Myb/SANT-like DNA-binding domain
LPTFWGNPHFHEYGDFEDPPENPHIQNLPPEVNFQNGETPFSKRYCSLLNGLISVRYEHEAILLKHLYLGVHIFFAMAEKDRITWTDQYKKAIINLMGIEVLKGNFTDNSWKRAALHTMVESFNATFNRHIVVTQLTSFISAIKGRYKGYAALLENSGFGIDPISRVPTASSSVWADFLACHKNCDDFKKAALPYYDELHLIFGGKVATGNFTYNGTRTPAQTAVAVINRSQTYDTPTTEVNDREVNDNDFPSYDAAAYSTPQFPSDDVLLASLTQHLPEEAAMRNAIYESQHFPAMGRPPLPPTVSGRPSGLPSQPPVANVQNLKRPTAAVTTPRQNQPPYKKFKPVTAAESCVLMLDRIASNQDRSFAKESVLTQAMRLFTQDYSKDVPTPIRMKFKNMLNRDNFAEIFIGYTDRERLAAVAEVMQNV